MAILTTKSIIFTEFEGILFDTDTFVIRKIYDTFKNNRESCIFNELLDKIDRNGEDNIKYIGQVKKNMNPILEYISEDIEERDELSYRIYQDILYAKYGSIEPFDELTKTIIGRSIDMIVRDENFQQLYVYCKNPTPEISDFIYTILSNVKVEIIGGDEGEFLRTVPCTSYFIADATNILNIIDLDHGDSPVEIYVPEYSFNMNDTNGTILLDPPIEKMNLSDSILINSMKLPIV